MLAKPEPRKRVKARRKRQDSKARAICREIVYAREQMACERCGLPARRPEDCYWEGDPWMAHINERLPRSRGGDPTNPDHCELVHQMCHMPNGRHAPTPERLAILTGRQKGKA